MIIGMPVITETCTAGHLQTRDNVVRSKGGASWCVACLHRDGLRASHGLGILQRQGVDFAEVGEIPWVPASELRAAYERGMTVASLGRTLGRAVSTIRNRIVEAGGTIRPNGYVDKRKFVKKALPDTGPLLRIAHCALADAWGHSSAAVRINEEASRLADELMAGVDLYDQWQDCEPHLDLGAMGSSKSASVRARVTRAAERATVPPDSSV